MKKILLVTLILSVITAACIGCLIIFEVYSFDEGARFLLKAIGVIFLLGAASAAVALLIGNKTPPDQS